MAYLMGRLVQLQAEQAAFERLVNGATGLGLPGARIGQVERLLHRTTSNDLQQRLLGALDSPGLPRAEALLGERASVMAQTLQAASLGAAALSSYRLDSPKLLSAARTHGVGDRILRAVHEQLG